MSLYSYMFFGLAGCCVGCYEAKTWVAGWSGMHEQY